MEARRIFVGDVQGCRKALERLLDEVRFRPGRDQLFLTGDLVNRGPDSVGVLRLVRSLGGRSVLGNHDAHLLDVARGRAALRKKETFQDVLVDPHREELLSWLEQQPILLHLRDVVLVHAAIRPGWGQLSRRSEDLNERLLSFHRNDVSPFEDADLRFALSARYCRRDGVQAAVDWPPPAPPYRNWVQFLRAEETVVFGHFARQGLLVRSGLRGLDTGCVYGGRLTAWIAEEDRIASVPARTVSEP